MAPTPSNWQDRFRAEQVLWAEVAAGRRDRGIAATNRSGPVELHAWDVPTGELRQLTDRPAGTLLGFLGSDGRHVYYLDDREGGEVGHFVRVPWEGGPAEDVTPNLPAYSTFGGAVSSDGARFGFVLADADGNSLVAVDLGEDSSVGVPRELYRTDALLWPPSVSSDGSLLVTGSNERTGTRHCALIAFDGATGERIADLWDGPGSDLEAGPFAPNSAAGGLTGDWMAGTSDFTGFRHPFLWNPKTGERRDLETGSISGEIEPLDWSVDGSRLLLRQTHRATQRLWIYDVTTDAARRIDHGGGTYDGPSVFGPDGEVIACWEDAAHPPQVIGLDCSRGDRQDVLLPAGPVPPGRQLQSVTFASSDGVELQAWLGVPAGTGPFPAILHTHGGPEAVMPDAYLPAAQAWLDHGYAFLTENYRDSATFGREFQQAIWSNPGQLELEDIVAARVACCGGDRQGRPGLQDRRVVRWLPDAAGAGSPPRPVGGRDGGRAYCRLALAL